jgi:serine/threonine protein kinase
MENLEIYNMPLWSIVSELSSGPDSAEYEVYNKKGRRRANLRVSSIPSAAELAYIEKNMDEAEAAECLEYIIEEKKREFALQDQFVLDDYIVNMECHDIRKKKDEFGCELIVRTEVLKSLESFKGKEFSLEEVVRIGLDICKAIVALARKNVMHRDIKPSKIFVDEDGNYKLGDFSTAARVGREVTDGLVVGTLEYMAPEVLNRESYGFSVDIYSLGIVIRNLLAGKWSSLPYDMQTILCKSTSSREYRFIDANDMLKHLALFSADLKTKRPFEDSKFRPNITAKGKDKQPIIGVRDAGELLGDNPYKTINENSIFFKFPKKAIKIER